MSRLLPAALALLALLGGCAAAPPEPEASVRLPPEVRAHGDRQLVVTFPDSGIAARNAAGGSPRPYAGRRGYDGSSHAQWQAARLARDYGMRRVAAWHIGSLGVHCVVFEADDEAARDGLLARMRDDPRVETAQPMLAFETRGDVRGYDDPLFPLQTAVAALQVPEAHELAEGRAVRVAVIDTGVDTEHPDLAGRVPRTWNLVDGDMAGFRADRHGTAVAGVLAAVARNGLGIVGVAPGVEILAIKACWEAGPGLAGRCNTVTLAAAMDLAITEGAQVINLSLGGPEDPLLGRLAEAAIERGIVVVGSDGAALGDEPGFPAGVKGVLTVADADGPPAAARGRVAAPARNVLTLVPGGRFDYVSGESYATAMVSGIVALVLEREALAPEAVMALLAETAAPGLHSGGAVVNACRAVAGSAPALRCGPALAAAESAGPAGDEE